MKRFQGAILAIGACAFALLLWKLDAAEVLRLLAGVGWGFLFLLTQEAAAHALNALGWRFSMSGRHARMFRYGDLLRHRIQGDGVNYLTPSGTIAGEYTRALLIDNSVSGEIRLHGVVVAKCTQSLGQVLFVLLGLALLVPAGPWVRRGAWGALAALAACAALFRRLGPGSRSGSGPLTGGLKAWMKAVPGHVGRYFLDHPGRWWLSTLLFLLGFAWTTVEVYAACRFIGVSVSWRTALIIEVLSNATDIAFFMVPAKVGTQEGGKTAIFHFLGLGAQAGLALGILRHLRELAWAAAGILLYGLELRRNPGASLRESISTAG